MIEGINGFTQNSLNDVAKFSQKAYHKVLESYTKQTDTSQRFSKQVWGHSWTRIAFTGIAISATINALAHCLLFGVHTLVLSILKNHSHTKLYDKISSFRKGCVTRSVGSGAVAALSLLATISPQMSHNFHFTTTTATDTPKNLEFEPFIPLKA
ncbi:MAG: hypothetical protein ACQEP8_06740 [Chlamydiota bacterium]